MSNLYTIQKQTLMGIADAIRTQNGTSGVLKPHEMAAAISQIQTGGGAEFNIAYGETAPEDPSKLWVKTTEPVALRITSSMVVGNENLETSVSALPEATRLMTAVNVEAKIYLFGGITGDTYSNDIYVFDPSSNYVSVVNAVLPWEVYGMASAAVDRRIYLFGGEIAPPDSYNRLDTISVFDTQTNAISTLNTKLPYELVNHAAAAGNGKIFLFGGYNGVRNQRTIHMFDPETEAVTTLATKLPKECSYHTAVTVGSKVYIFGGVNSEEYLSDIHVFDTNTFALTTLSVKLPVPTRAMAAAAVGTKIYLFGGRVADGRLSDIQVFDTETCTLSTLTASLPSVTAFAMAAAVGMRIYVFGGSDGTDDLRTIHELVTEFPLAENNILIKTTLRDNLVSLLPNMEIGIADVYCGNADGKAEKVPAAVYKDGAWAEI